MKHRFARGLVLLCFFVGAFQGSALGNSEISETKQYDWQAKLKRGAINIGTSPVEVAREIQMTSNEKNLLSGWTVGLVKGLGQAVVRLGSGLIDVLTCPFNFPDPHKGPLMEPEFVWQKPGVKYS